ncbi:HlyD family secretion protein [Desulfovirgula thermocuniculi]|uniref:HlyD family secretion protein n=1 Tax=Desulfovirgula thermocuniculi TaxID=348842 RepID=UPI000421B3BE|nr:efflux RND transporter periplasmic adaptor subunit [Desulfovirgula thermocuniculi]
MNNKNKKVIVAVLLLAVLSLAGVSFYYWYTNAYFVSTEDAKVDADLFRVSPQVSGKILEVYVEEGQAVRAGEVVARLDDTTLQAANPDLAVVRAPVDGLVVKKLARPGEMAAPGQPVVVLVDPKDLYVTANIEEDKLRRVRVGQQVDISLDALPGKTFTGRVERIGKASLSVFSLLPSSSGGSFTKVVQRVPVKIVFNEKPGEYVEVGTNAFVRIHVK